MDAHSLAANDYALFCQKALEPDYKVLQTHAAADGNGAAAGNAVAAGMALPQLLRCLLLLCLLTQTQMHLCLLIDLSSFYCSYRNKI
jgi:hypothetical protein